MSLTLIADICNRAESANDLESTEDSRCNREMQTCDEKKDHWYREGFKEILVNSLGFVENQPIAVSKSLRVHSCTHIRVSTFFDFLSGSILEKGG